MEFSWTWNVATDVKDQVLLSHAQMIRVGTFAGQETFWTTGTVGSFATGQKAERP